jgi:hypothetical protein
LVQCGSMPTLCKYKKVLSVPTDSHAAEQKFSRTSVVAIFGNLRLHFQEIGMCDGTEAFLFV